MTSPELLNEFKETIEKIKSEKILNEWKKHYEDRLNYFKKCQQTISSKQPSEDLIYYTKCIKKNTARLELIENQLYILEFQQRQEEIINKYTNDIKLLEEN